MKIKAGIIGCGGIANNKHLPAIRKVDRMEMVAFCDIIRERAEKAAAEYGAPGARVYTDYKELLAEELDVVYVHPTARILLSRWTRCTAASM